ncbi:MAG: hypothetical protein LBK91_04500, partial [Synergistaceae bacterium]|jgi:hypothetical protein|nr:hypothetical protein [Synergistaceae bacterium]
MFILQNLFLLEGVHFPVKERFPEPPMDIFIRNGYAGSIYTCVASCDLVYFYKYAENFIKEFKNACPGVNIFLLAVNPNKNMINRTKAFDGVTLGATGYKGKWTAEFAASARFMLADKILTETGGPTIFMDIDSRFPDGTSDILSLLSRENLAVCDTGSLFPFNIISAALLCARPCEESFNFFGAVKECILSDFAREGPLWGLDQTALYRAVCIGKEKGWNISETNGLLNGRAKLPDFFVMNEDETVPLERRTGKRTNNFYRLTGFSDEGRTIYDLNRSQIYL